MFLSIVENAISNQRNNDFIILFNLDVAIFALSN